jgi:4,5-dihydroxyphthalate decarboxylase
MAKLQLALACGRYDRTRALADGTVPVQGVDLNYFPLGPEEIFFRMLRQREFDCAEMSLSSYVMSLGREDRPFIAIPVFPSRLFRHSCIFVSAKSGITRPEQLAGKRIGVPEYQMTAPVWIRGILSDEYGVGVKTPEYFSGGEEQPGRVEKLALSLPSDFRVRPIGPTQTLSQMLADGEIDALHTARAPSTYYSEPDKVRRLFENYSEVERAYYRKTRIFPIMHTFVIRREVYEKHRWVARSLYQAFTEAQRITYEDLDDTGTLQAMLPWLVSHVEDAKREMGNDWWPYGIEPNRHVLETFLRYHHEQGLSKQRLTPEDIFAPETLESFKV